MENQAQMPIVNSPQTTVIKTMDQTPKKNNFLAILLSVLLLISLTIAGFFAWQTQKLTSELRIMNDELRIKPTSTPIASAEPTTDPTVECKNLVLGLSLKLPNNIWRCKNHEDGYTLTATSDIFNIQISSLGRGDYCEPPIRDPQSPRYDPTF